MWKFLKALIWIGVLIWLALAFGLWTAIGFFVLAMMVLFLWGMGVASLTWKKEAIRQAKADYIEGTREYQRHYKAQLHNEQQHMRNALAWIERCKRESEEEHHLAEAIEGYEESKREIDRLEKKIAECAKMERKAINSKGAFKYGFWSPAIIAGCVMLSVLITAPRAHAELPQCKDVSAGTPCQREPTREEAMLNSPSRVYAERDYMIDCHSYKWKERHFHLKRGSACVFRNCRANPPEICAGGNWGPVPRKLLREQLRDLGRVPRWENVTTDPKPWEKKKSAGD